MVGGTALNCSLVLFCLVRFSVVLFSIVQYCMVLFSFVQFSFCNNILAQNAYANGILCYFSSKIALHQRKNSNPFVTRSIANAKQKIAFLLIPHPVSIHLNILPWVGVLKKFLYLMTGSLKDCLIVGCSKMFYYSQ